MIIDDGELWSLFRSVLELGAAIQQDYQAGKFSCYEDFSAHLDKAARERVDRLKSKET